MKLSILYRGPLSSCNYGCDYCPFAKHRETYAEHQHDQQALERFLNWVANRAGDQIGIFFTPSPRFADLLLVTGPVTRAMHEPLKAAYDAMPEPRWVMAVGTCAVSGGIAGGNYACGTGLEGVLPVDLYLPGCPPNPAAIMEALLMFLDRAPQQVRGGQISD